MESTKRSKEELDDLLKLVESEPNAPTEKEYSDVEQFIYELNIRAGETAIPLYLVFYTYQNWSRQSKPLTKVQFGKEFRKFFTQHHLGVKAAAVGYYLDPTPFDMSLDAYWKIQKIKRQKEVDKWKKNYGAKYMREYRAKKKEKESKT